jgi:hypothetical protein
MSLKLIFATPADEGRILSVYNSGEEKIYRRKRSIFMKSLENGSIVFLEDEAWNIQSIAFAFHENAPGNHGNSQDYTEIGSVLSLLPGYSSAELLVSLLVLKEWRKTPPRQYMVATIDPDNGPSLRVFRNLLLWSKIYDPELCESLARASWNACADQTDPSGERSIEVLTDKMLHSWDWYECPEEHLPFQAETALKFLDRRGLVHKRTGHFLPVDFSILGKLPPKDAAVMRLMLRDAAMAAMQPRPYLQINLGCLDSEKLVAVEGLEPPTQGL